MTDRLLTPTAPPRDSTAASTSTPLRARFSVTCEGHEVGLPPGKLIMGRGSRCHIVIDDLLASREHARLTVTEAGVVVEDLGSTNGVYVNEKKIQAPTQLHHGDRMVIGTQELELKENAQQPSKDDHAMDFKDLAMIVPVPKQRPVLDMDEPGVMASPPTPEPTQKADVVTTLGRLADRMLTMGRFDAAERVLEGQLKEVLSGMRAGRPAPPALFETAVEYGLRLAEVMRKPSWMDYVVEMHLADVRVMNGAVVTRVASLLPGMGNEIDKELLFFYQESLRKRRSDLPLSEQINCDRILKLELPA